jgi:hypothetical protein
MDHAIDESGGVKAAAIAGIRLIVAGGNADTTSRNTASTAVYTEAEALTDYLPDERARWSVLVDGDLRATVSDGTNADIELLVNGAVVDTVTRPASSTVPTPFFLLGNLHGPNALPGDQEVEFVLRFKSDTGGTVTVGLQRLRYFCFREI